MVTPRFNPPPPPSTPASAPWDDVQKLVTRLDRLLEVWGAGAIPDITIRGALGVPGVLTPAQQMVLYLQSISPGALGHSAIIPFQKAIGTSSSDEQTRSVAISGVISEVIMAFPAGCQQLVEVRLIYVPREGGPEYVVPSLADAFIALDDFTQVFRPSYPVRAPGVLKVEWYNYDTLNEHNVPVIATISPSAAGAPPL